MNLTLLHVTRQDVACFVLCVLIKIPCLITTFRRQLLFTRRSSRYGAPGSFYTIIRSAEISLITISTGRKSPNAGLQLYSQFRLKRCVRSRWRRSARWTFPDDISVPISSTSRLVFFRWGRRQTDSDLRTPATSRCDASPTRQTDNPAVLLRVFSASSHCNSNSFHPSGPKIYH